MEQESINKKNKQNIKQFFNFWFHNFLCDRIESHWCTTFTKHTTTRLINLMKIKFKIPITRHS